jgi:hypothetical protein
VLRAISKEAFHGCHGIYGRGGLETGKVRDSREKGMVEDAGIIHEGPYYFL